MDHLLNFHAENQKIVQTTTYNILWVLHRECQKGSLHKHEYVIILLLEGFGNPQYIYIYIIIKSFNSTPFQIVFSQQWFQSIASAWAGPMLVPIEAWTTNVATCRIGSAAWCHTNNICSVCRVPYLGRGEHTVHWIIFTNHTYIKQYKK